MRIALISLLLLSSLSFLPQNTHASNIMSSNNKLTEQRNKQKKQKKQYNPKKFELKDGQTMLDALLERRDEALKKKKQNEKKKLEEKRERAGKVRDRIHNKATKSQPDKWKKDTEKKIDKLDPRKTEIDDLTDLRHRNIELEQEKTNDTKK